MKPERIEEMRRNVEIVVAEAARNGDHKIEHWVKTAELLHLLRCARAVAELEEFLRGHAPDIMHVEHEWRVGFRRGVLSLDIETPSPDLLTAIEAALARAKETT